MAVVCPSCGRQYDATLFQFGREVLCECGRVVRGAGHTIELGPSSIKPAPRDTLRHTGKRSLRKRALAGSGGRAGMEELARAADRIVDQILDRECARIDVVLACERLRERCRELFPDTEDLFTMIYEARFARLFRQFRGGDLWRTGNDEDLSE